jgi:hypothetical protein
VNGRATSAEEFEARVAARCAGFAPPPKVELPTLDRFLVRELYQMGGGEFDELERCLVMSARVEGPLELTIAEGLLELTVGDRLLRLGLRLDDYAREVLDLSPSTAMKRVRLARRLQTRPLLRQALRSGRVSLRAAEVVAPVARGDAEAEWVARASTQTVRALEALVRTAQGSADDPREDAWGRLGVDATEEDLAVVDRALEVAGQQLPGSKPFERLEALAQEWLGGHPEAAPERDPHPGAVFRTSGPHASALPQRESQRQEELEVETERWRSLDDVPRWRAPEIRWGEIEASDSVELVDELDATLRRLARHREGWDEHLAWAAAELSASGLLSTMGFASFRHYITERLGLPPRAIEQRARLERRIRRSPALAQARAAGVSYERLRTLAALREEKEVLSWIPRAKDLTVVALRDALDAAEARQMRARRRLGAAMPARVAGLVSAAIESVRGLAGAPLPPGRCLAIIAQHFLDTQGPPARPRTSSQKVRARDGWRCSVPGCSHHAVHSHHIEFLSRGGARRDPANQAGLCAFHHAAIHKGYMRLTGSAPDRLVWTLRGRPWAGRPWAGDRA